MNIKKISLFSLVLLIVASLDSIRNFPAAALFGSSLIFFFIFSAIVFLIPTGLVSAELSATFPDKGGVYHWVSKAFGPKLAMVAIWLQWINTMVWYPSILSFVAGTAAYMIDPNLVHNKIYLVSIILGVFWLLTLINLRGIHTGAKVNAFCALIGTVLPMLILISLGVYWVVSGQPKHIQVSTDTIFPSLAQSATWTALIGVMASFLGMELAGVHVGDIRNPQRNFPRAVLFASIFILVTMILGSLTIAYVVAGSEINLVAGVMQVFTAVLGIPRLVPVIAMLIVIGTVGGITNWLVAPAKGLLHAAEFGFLPNKFKKKNKHDVPASIMIAQAILVSIFCLLFLLVPGVNAFYWFLTALSTELYMFMYILVFLSALKLHYSLPDRSKVFKIPGKSVGMWITCLLGFLGCIATIIVSFFPPTAIDVGHPLRYSLMIIVGNILTITPVLFFINYRKKTLV